MRRLRMGRKMKRMPWMRPWQGSCPLWRGSLTITGRRSICRNLRDVTGISPEMQLLELIDQAARCGTPEDAKQIYRKDATSTGIYDRGRANLPANKMREFNLLARNAAKLGGKLSKLAEMCPERVQVRKEGGGRRNVYTIARSVTG